MDLYVFTSRSLENIVIGYQLQLWAVSPGKNPGFRTGVRTKATQMPVSSIGIFWSVDREEFTVPFIVRSSPANDNAVRGVWDGEWISPFEIAPLGTPAHRLHKSCARCRWPFLIGVKNLSHRIRMTPTQTFVPTPISSNDWTQILVDLAC